MIFPEVKYLYKYTSYNTNSISLIVNDELWCARPVTFNDPLDCGIQLLSEISPEAVVRVIEDVIEKLKAEGGDECDSKIEKYKKLIDLIKVSDGEFDYFDGFAEALARDALNKSIGDNSARF